jgi:hypothetical protein
MSGGSGKREMETNEKATTHGKAPSRESGTKVKEGSPPRVKSHRSSDKKKKMKKVSTTKLTLRRIGVATRRRR